MPDIVEKILKNRGYKDKKSREKFLSPDYSSHTHDPVFLPGMDLATERVKQAIDKGERIVIYGDYDIDGLSATALLVDGLGGMGAQVEAYIPDRFDEGYGINTAALKKLQTQGAQLIITVDCGSVSHEPIEWAEQAGLDVIVTDHHEVLSSAAGGLPPAVAVINPKRPDSGYPFNDLAGVGVAFKLIQALQSEYGLLPQGQEKWLLDLVALGTVCDVVDLVGENRVFVYYGLRVFARTRRVGLRALAEVAGVDIAHVDTYHFGFMLGPRLNAAGRLEHAKKSLELLVSEDEASAKDAAGHLDELNTDRRSQQANILSEATQQAESYSDDPVLVLSHPEWNHGIVGIVASKLVEQFHKPAIVLQETGGLAKGSARSLGGFNMVAGMRAADEVLDKYGGHHVAAGCTLKKTNVGRLRELINSYYNEQQFGDLYELPRPDVQLDDFSDINMDAYEQLQQLAPFGKGNEKPLFYMPSTHVQQARRVGDKQQHLKLQLSDGSNTFDAIAFGKGGYDLSVNDAVGVWFELGQNNYNGQCKLQLLVKDLS